MSGKINHFEIELEGGTYPSNIYQTNSDVKNTVQINTDIENDTIFFEEISINDITNYNYREIYDNILQEEIISGERLFKNPRFDETKIYKIYTTARKLFIAASALTNIASGLLLLSSDKYYLYRMSKQFRYIDSKLNQLIQFHHTEKISKLENAHKLLKNLFETRHPNIEHLTQLKVIETEVGDIYNEYLRYLEQLVSDSSSFKESLKWSSTKDLKNLLNIYGKSGIAFNLHMITTADEILHLIPIIEFLLDVKINSITNNRGNQINELCTKISKLKI